MKNIFLLVMMVSSMQIVIAQPGHGEGKKEEIESMKIAFLTRKLDLTPTEAQTFWPVYNQYQAEMDKHRDGRKSEMRSARENFDTMSDKDMEKIVDGEIAFRQGEIDILKKYHSQFKKSLPAKKVALLYRAEEDFKRELLKRIQDRHEGKGRGTR